MAPAPYPAPRAFEGSQFRAHDGSIGQVDFDDLAAAPASYVLTAGGWNPSYARLLRVVSVGDEALALIDTNGDGAEFAADVWHRMENGHWESVGSIVVGGFSQWSGSRGGLLWTVGQASARGHVLVAAHDGIHDVVVDADGFWVIAEDKEADGVYPYIVG